MSVTQQNTIVATVTSGSNTYNPSSLVSKTVMGLLKAKPTLAKFANSNHNRIFSEKNKPYAPGTTYTLNIPTYPQIQYGASVNPTAKNIRTATINIDTSATAERSGYINAVRVIDQISEQLYLQDRDEWNRQYVKPVYDAFYGQINSFLYRQLRNSAAYTATPRYLNDRGYGNEADGRFVMGDIAMFTLLLDYMAGMNMNNYEDFIVCMSTTSFYEFMNSTAGVIPGNLPAGIANRYTNKFNEKAVEDGILNKAFGLYIYHTPYIPDHISGTNSYATTAGTLPDAGTNFDFNRNGGVVTTATVLPEAFACRGYNTTTGSTPPTPVGATVADAPFDIVTIPETAGYLILALTTGATAQTNSLTFQFNPGDTLILSPLDDDTATNNTLALTAVDPITKQQRPASFRCNVACEHPFRVTVANTAANTTAYFYIPVNFLPYGPDPITVVSGVNQYNELQAIGLKNSVTTSIYDAPSGSNVFFLTTTRASLRQLGNHSKIFAFSKNGLHFVNPPLSDIVGAENKQVYDDEARMSLLTTIQGGVTAGTNIMRTSSLWGSGGITDAIVQLCYYRG